MSLCKEEECQQSSRTVSNKNESVVNTHKEEDLQINVTVIEVETGKIKAQFEDLYDQEFNAAAITNDGRAVVGYWGYTRVYDINGRVLKEIPYGASCLSINPSDNNILALGSESGVIRIFNIVTGQLLKEWESHIDFLNGLEFNRNDGNRLLSYSSQKMQVWDFNTGTKVGNEYEYFFYPTPAISFDGMRLAYGRHHTDQGNIFYIVDVESGNTVTTEPYNFGYMYRCAFNPNGKELLASFYPDEYIKCFQHRERQLDIVQFSTLSGMKLGTPFEGGAEYFIDIYPSNSDNNLLVSTNPYGSVVLIWNQNTRKIEKYVELSSGITADRSYVSPDGLYLVIAGQTPKTQSSPVITKEQDMWAKLRQQHAPSSLPHAISSNLDEVTNTVIKSLDISAPVCAGISELNINDAILKGLKEKVDARYPITDHPDLFIGITPSHVEDIKVTIDQLQKKVKVKIPLFLDLYHKAEERLTHLISRTRLTFTVLAEPHMATIDENIAQELHLNFKESTLDPNKKIFIIDCLTVLRAFGSEAAFTEFIEEIIASMLDATGDGVSLYLPSLVMDAPIPQVWNRAREYELLFHDFSFQSVSVQTTSGPEDVGYLFVSFSLINYGFPPHCLCGEEKKDNDSISKKDSIDPRRWVSLAFSQEALNILATSHSSSGNRNGKSNDGRLYWSANSYFKSTLGTIEIERDRLIAPVSVDGRGSLSVGLRDLFKTSVIRETTRLSLSASDVMTSWEIALLSDFPSKEVTSMVLLPTIHINPEKIYVELDMDLPTPVEDAYHLMMKWFKDVFSHDMSTAIHKVSFIELLYDVYRYDNKDCDFRFIHTQSRIFNGSSITLIAEAISCECEIWPH
ncbi:WD40 repeat domain-containing protein [Wukongibacter baidiensis]